MPVRIYIVEDNELMREMLEEFIDSISDFEVAGKSILAEDAARALRHTRADLVLVDMSLPDMSGDDLVRKLLEHQPDLPCLVYSAHGEAGYIDKALAAGARGYLIKGAPEELSKAIRKVLGGETYLSSDLGRL